MRMWDIPPHLLCQKHLLGEHVETHMFAGWIRKGKPIDGFIDRGLVNPHKITIRHDQLMYEMLRRGLNHKSILEFDSAYLPRYPINQTESLRELSARCEQCKARIKAEVEG